MKADYTRSTFKAKKHYSSVRMQQGRVQLDADWNEQVDLTAHRVETETVDSLGHCGAPMHRAGFHIVKDATALTTEEKKMPENAITGPAISDNDFYISGGRYYVGGILCENENIVPFSKQPDVPLDAVVKSLPANFPERDKILQEIQPPSEPGTYLAYMDVWSRHITALEDKEIREVALGGPDTATRTKTVWQVKLLKVGGTKADFNCLSSNADWDALVKGPDGRLAAQAEVKEEEDKPCIIAPGAGYRRLENQLYRVEVHEGGKLGGATFKWSRDNGAIVAKWEDKDGDKLTVSSTGRDNVLSFAVGQWVELIDDTRELLGQPGTLVRLKNVEKEGSVLTIDATTKKGSVELTDFPGNPRVRRWDTVAKEGTLKPTNTNFIDLEDGVQVSFSAGKYRTGDYWLIPARTATANVEWPVDDTGKPELQLPHGIRHHYCRLAILRFDGTDWIKDGVSDCRRVFPPITELTSLFYVGGGGQEAMPGDQLPKPLQVGVSNGRWPVSNVRIRFKRPDGGNLLPGVSAVVPVPGLPADELVVLTGADGVAECYWTPDASKSKPSQQVEAVLWDAADDPMHLPIRFTANLSIASQVYYDPAGCASLLGAGNVQLALEKLSGLTTVAHLGGDGQQAKSDGTLPQLLKVSVANKCGPVNKAKVRFFAEGSGQVAADQGGLGVSGTSTIDIVTGPDGVAGCAWKLENDPAKPSQELTATLINAAGNPIQQPAFMRFTANLRPQIEGGCAITVGSGGKYDTLSQAFTELQEQKDISICLLPGAPIVEDQDVTVGEKNSIKITGCCSTIMFNAATFSLSADKIVLRDFGLRASNRNGTVVLAAKEVAVDHCEFIRIADAGGSPFVLIKPAGTANSKAVLHWKNNYVSARWSKKGNLKAKDHFEAATPISAVKKALDGVVALAGIDPVENEEAFNTTLANTVGEIQKLSGRNRKKWQEESPRATIDKLSKRRSAPIYRFFDAIKADTIDTAELRNSIVGAVAVFYDSGYSEALALSYGVGGWIEDSRLSGYLTLHYYPKFTSLSWAKATDETLANRRRFLKDHQYITVDPVALTLRGNNLYAVNSNGYSIMQVMDDILNTGDWSHEMPETGYEFLTVTGNIFDSNGSGFVCQSLVMNENTFANKVGQAQDIAAFVLGYSGIFTGNSGASQSLTIETMLRDGWRRESANIVSIVQ